MRFHTHEHVGGSFTVIDNFVIVNVSVQSTIIVVVVTGLLPEIFFLLSIVTANRSQAIN